MFGYEWKRYAQDLRDQVTCRNRDIKRLRAQRDAQRQANEELRAEIKRLKSAPKGGPYIQVIGRDIYLGGHRIEGVMSVDHAVRPDSLPQTTLVLHGEYSTTERRKLEVRSPIDFSKHRPDCLLSWQLTAAAKGYYAFAQSASIGDWLEAGWTLQLMEREGFIEPKA